MKNSNKAVFRMSNNIFLQCISLTFFMAGIIFISACEDVIDVTLEDGGEALVVDAWINNLEEDQEIILNLSQPYFDNSIPPAVENANVRIVRDDGATFDFSHDQNGRFIWSSQGESLGEVDDQFELMITIGSDQYSSQTQIYRVPQIDSIGIEFREDELFSEDGLYAQFYARDMVGHGDTYWIKTYKNGEFLDKSQLLNIAFDAGFDAGTGIDGLVFIPPIRELVNELDEDLLQIPYDVDDEVTVEIHSISNAAFNFLEVARDQINNGDNGIFSIPLANTRTNVQASRDNVALGFFNIAAISSDSKIVE